MNRDREYSSTLVEWVLFTAVKPSAYAVTTEQLLKNALFMPWVTAFLHLDFQDTGIAVGTSCT